MSNKRTFITQSGRRQAIRWWLTATALLPHSGNWVCSHCRTSKTKGNFSLMFDVTAQLKSLRTLSCLLSVNQLLRFIHTGRKWQRHWVTQKRTKSQKKISLSFSCLVSVNEPYVWRTGVAWGSPCCCGAGAGGGGGCGKRTQCSRQRGD